MSNPRLQHSAEDLEFGSEPGTPASVLDAQALLQLRELDPSGENRVMERVLRAFESSLSSLLAQAETAQLQDDRDTIRHVAHTLKSSSASVGALELSRRCAATETLLREQTDADLFPHVRGMRSEGQRVLVAVQAALRG